MPIKIQSDLPVKEILEQENIFVMDDKMCIRDRQYSGTSWRTGK